MDAINQLTTPDKSFTEITEILKNVKSQHERISQIVTPPGVVKQRPDGYDYVELGYMKGLVDKEFPGWSLEVIKYEFVGNQAISVHGRLKWYDNGIFRSGDIIAAHRIQKSRADQTKYIDIGNDIKSAVTDCQKKAFNTYMNICDDIYKKMYPMIGIEQMKKLLALAKIVGNEEIIEEMAINGEITTENYEASIKKLQKLIEEQSLTETDNLTLKGD